MAVNNVNEVNVGKPKVGGAIFRAPKGSKLPTDAASALDTAFTSLGYISDDGVTIGTDIETTTIKAWGGDVVANSQTGKTVTASFTLIQSSDTDVLKLIYGYANVSTSENDVTVKDNNTEADESVIVIDTILRSGKAHRDVFPLAKITSLGDITYADDSVVGYNPTMTCAADSDGNYHYSYFAK